MKIKTLTLPLLIIGLLCITPCYGAERNDSILKNTFLYAIKGTDSLYLDKYELPEATASSKKPCMIFVFGGGFTHGQRDKKEYVTYFKHLVEKGYVVASIDYRLGLKNAQKEKGLNAEKFISLFKESINMATEDLYDATRYILSYAEEWNIDSTAVITTGSSAGAITVLHAEYGICNKSGLSKRLPAGFNYAGVIACAGAIFTETGGLNWKNNPSPILMFHGDTDKNVPYDKIKILQLGLYGSKYIAGQLNRMPSPYYFYDIENAGHEMAVRPLIKNHNEIDTFLDDFVKNKRPLIIHEKIQQLDKPLTIKNFSIQDYIKANMGN